MKGKKEKEQPTENKNNNFPSLNSVISNISYLRPNKITYQLINTNKPKYRLKKNSFPCENSKSTQNCQSPSKLDIEKVRLSQLTNSIDEKPEISADIQKKKIRKINPKRKIITKTGPLKL